MFIFMKYFDNFVLKVSVQKMEKRLLYVICCLFDNKCVINCDRLEVISMMMVLLCIVVQITAIGKAHPR